MPNTSLSPEEQEYFASGGVSSLPDDYAKDVPPEPKQENGNQSDGGKGDGDDSQNARTDQNGKDKDQQTGQTADQQNKDGGDQDGQRGPVPYGALKSERDRRRDAERRAALIEERFNATLDMLQRQQPQQQPAPTQEQAPQLPDPMSDPLGAIQSIYDWRNEQDQSARQRREQEQEQVRQQRENERVWHQVDGEYTRVMTETFEDFPEVKEAREHLINSRINELVAYGMSQQDAVQRASFEEFQMAHSALSQRQHPAHRVVASAEARGWKNPRRQQEQQSNGQGRPPGAAPNAGGQNSDADRLASVAAGQRANASVGTAGTGGNARGGRLSAKDLVDMPIKDFKKFLERDSDGEDWKRIMGG